MDQQLERVRNKSQVLLEKRQRVPLNVTTKLFENFNQIKFLMAQCQLEPESQCEDLRETVISSMEVGGFARGASLRDPQPAALLPPPPPVPKSKRSNLPPPTATDENFDSFNQSTQSGDGETAKDSVLPTLPSEPAALPVPPPPPPVLRSRNQFNGTISTEEFNNVAAHVRGRCSLHDTQRLLTHLRNVSRPSSASSSAPQMSVQQLDQLGYRVCGQTGLCMLKTLQKLGYIELSKRGDLVSLSALGLQGVQPLAASTQTQKRRK
jgi:hypothetical protein